MRRRKTSVSCVFRISFKSAPERRRRSLESYRKFLRLIAPKTSGKLRRGHPRELSLHSGGRLTQELNSVLLKNKTLKSDVLVFELAGADYHKFDDFASCLYVALDSKGVDQPRWVVFVIGEKDREDFEKSVFVQRNLVPRLKDRQINMLIEYEGGRTPPRLLTGKWPTGAPLPELDIAENASATGSGNAGVLEPVQTPLSTQEIAKRIHILFGHFELDRRSFSTPYHLPGIIALGELSRDQRFIARVSADLEKIGGSSFQVVYAPAVEATGVEVVAAAVASDKLIPTIDIVGMTSGTCVILTDVFASPDQFQPLITAARQKGVKIGGILAIAKYRDVQCDGGATVVSYADLPYKSAPTDACDFCSQGSEALRAKNLPDIENEISNFDDFTFWELIRSDSRFYAVGHDVVPRTRYHYHFRIIAKHLFEKHSYGLALRMRNALRDASVFPEWIKKIVCADDSELLELARHLARVFHRSPENDVVVIKREDFHQVAGKRIEQAFRNRFRKDGGQKLLGRNVLIVDQAAHHFKTVATLAFVCAEFDSTVLAFSVLVSRVSPELTLGIHLPFSHYVPLYTWPCPPNRPHECACQQ